jgi:hypothetical protein
MSGKFLNPSPSVGAAGTQAKRMWLGIYTASVVSTQDPLKQSRVTLKVPQVLGTSTSNWAVPIGFEPVIPAVNQVVWAMFLGGDINHPLYLYASTVNTTTAVPGLPTVSIVNGVTITNSTINTPTVNNGTLNNPIITGSNQSMSAGTGTVGADSSGMALSGGTGSDASGALNYTTTTGTTVSPVSWSATGASVIGSVTAAAPGASSSVALTSETWHSGTLQNGWVNQGGANVVFRYRLTALNSVEIIGVINGGSASSSQFFQLPANYRPATQQPVCSAVSTSWVSGFIQCDTSGNLTMQASSFGIANPWVFHGFVSLNV